MIMSSGGRSKEPKVATYFISNMDCVNEEKLIRERLEGIAGVQGLAFDLAQRRLEVTHVLDGDDEVLAHLRAVGMRPVRVGPST